MQDQKMMDKIAKVHFSPVDLFWSVISGLAFSDDHSLHEDGGISSQPSLRSEINSVAATKAV